MTKYPLPAQMPPEKTQGLLASYVLGFGLSITFTLIAYFGVTQNWFGSSTVLGLLALAVLQFVVQLFFFLHVGRETRPRWKLFMLFLAIVVVLIVVLGSIWIMYSLNYRMTSDRVEQYLKTQDGGI
ncbi:cytochrome o ubiquinol oxidase subunit IV [soil metagenome]